MRRPQPSSSVRWLLAAALAVHATLLPAQTAADSSARRLPHAVVTGTRAAADIRHLPQTVSVVGRDKLGEPGRTNVLPALNEQVPGLFATSRGMMGYGVSDGAAGGINLRGLGSGAGRVLVLVDGHPQYQGIFGHALADAYQTLLAERVEVLRGPASVIYGSNAMGGVVNIVTRQPAADGAVTDIRLGAGSYGTVQGEVTNRLRAGRFGSVVAGQYGRSDNHRPHMGFEQYGGYAKAAYDFSDAWRVSADLDLTHFNASYPGAVQVPVYGARQWVTRGVASLTVENRYGKTSGALNIYHNFGRHKINDGYEAGEVPPDFYFRSDDAVSGLSWYQSTALADEGRLTLGLDYRHLYGRAWQRDIATGGIVGAPIGHRHDNEVAVYADWRQDLAAWLTLDAGLRFNHHSQAGGEWVPQGGLVFRLPGDNELKAMVSKGFRNPSIREMYFWRPANDALRPERLMSYELSWQGRTGRRFSYGAALFCIDARNLIQTRRIDNRPMNVNTGAVTNCGAELNWTWRAARHWRLNGNGSYLHTDKPLEGAPAFKGYLGADFDRGCWTAAAGLQYVADLVTGTEDGTTREDFCLLGASVSYAPAGGLKLWVKGENLLAQRYETLRGYPMPRATFTAGLQFTF